MSKLCVCVCARVCVFTLIQILCPPAAAACRGLIPLSSIHTRDVHGTNNSTALHTQT